MGGLMKEKEEVQLYLKNLGIEYRFSCFSEKNPEGCQLLGDYLQQIDEDFVKANKVFKDNCEQRKYGRSCSSYGLNQLYGRGVTKDVPEALRFLSRACEMNDPTGCDFAGKLLAGFEPQHTKAITEEPQKGLSYLEKGCNLASRSHPFEMSESCYAAAFMYGSGFKLASKDLPKGIALAVQSCELGKMEGCGLASELYRKQGDTANADIYYKRFQMFKKQMNESIEMQRT